MSSLTFTEAELSAALARGVRQCVIVGLRPSMRHVLESSVPQDLKIFALDENAGGTIGTALDDAGFDRLKAGLFVWLGGAGHRTMEGVIDALTFIASLPKGSGVVLDYAVERSTISSLAQTALDVFASRVMMASGSLKYLIRPLAVLALLRELGFKYIVDLAEDEVPLNSCRLVSAVV